MKVQKDPVMLTCFLDELDGITGQPPLIDDDGAAIPDNSMVEVFDATTKEVVSIWQYNEETETWYLYKA